jgi:hypothetical protein
MYYDHIYNMNEIETSFNQEVVQMSSLNDYKDIINMLEYQLTSHRIKIRMT